MPKETKNPKPVLEKSQGKSALAPLTIRSLNFQAYNPEKVTVNTYRKMRQDYQIAACLNMWAFTIRKVDWYLEGGSEETRDKIEKSLKKIWVKVVKVIAKSLWAGYSPATKEFTFDKELGIINIKTLRDLAPETCSIKVDDNGDFAGFYQRSGFVSSSKDDLIEPLYAFWYPNMMIDGNLYGESLLRAAYNPWYFSELTHLFANRYFERFGEPIVKGRAPSTTVTDAATGTNIDAMAMIQTIIENLKSHSTTTIPSDVDEQGKYLYDIEYLESNMRGVDFNMYLTRLDMEKARAIFIPDLLLGTGRVGSFELGKEHKATFLSALEGMFDDISEYVQKYIIDQLVLINYGEAEEVPKFRYLPLTPVDQDTIAKIIADAAKGGAVVLDVEKLAKMMGIPVLDASEIVVQPEVKKADQVEEGADLQDVKNQDVIKNQYNRVSKFVANIYNSRSSEEDKLIALESVNIGYREHFNKPGFDLAKWHRRQKNVRDYLASSFQQHISLPKVLEDLKKTLGITTTDDYFNSKAKSLAQEIESVTGTLDAENS